MRNEGNEAISKEIFEIESHYHIAAIELTDQNQILALGIFCICEVVF